jgi:hypothetical protein
MDCPCGTCPPCKKAAVVKASIKQKLKGMRGKKRDELKALLETPMVGSGFWSDTGAFLRRYILPATNAVVDTVGALASAVPLPQAQAIAFAADVGKQLRGSGIRPAMKKAKRRPADPDSKRARRARLVGALMREHGMTIGQASSYIKDQALEY